MIVYLDSSALVKLYISEEGTPETVDLVGRSSQIGTASISRAEVSAAFAKATRTGVLPRDEAFACLSRFRSSWPSLNNIRITEELIVRADEMAWHYGLRGYDSVQLAAAFSWQSWLSTPITFATFDARLWKAAHQSALRVFPAR